MDQAAQEPSVVATDKTMVFRQGPSSRHFQPKFDDVLAFRRGLVFGKPGLHVETQLGGNSKRSTIFLLEPVKVRALRDYLNELLGEGRP